MSKLPSECDPFVDALRIAKLNAAGQVVPVYDIYMDRFVWTFGYLQFPVSFSDDELQPNNPLRAKDYTKTGVPLATFKQWLDTYWKPKHRAMRDQADFKLNRNW